MPKNSTQFVCTECGYVSPRWLGRCPACNKFNTFIEEIADPMPKMKATNVLRKNTVKAIDEKAFLS